MVSDKTKFSVGLFMVAGLVIAVVVIVWLGASNYLEKGKKYVAYFDESVQGLDKDSPVKYRGVSIGKVQSIGVAPDSTLIEVVLGLDTEMKLESDMIAQLKSVGITGIMFIEIDRKKGAEPDYLPPISFNAEYPIVPTRPSDIKMVMNHIYDLRDLIAGLDTVGISERLKKTLDTLDRIVENVDKAVAGIDRIVTGNEKEFHEAVSALKKTLNEADKFFTQGSDLIDNSDVKLSALQNHLLATLQNLENASANLNSFIETISDQPSSLVFGEPPPSRKIGADK